MYAMQLEEDIFESDILEVISRAKTVSKTMKALSHEARLMILCHLVTGPKSVTELQNLVTGNQPSVSQHLTRLRLEKLVTSERIGKSIYYSLVDGQTADLIKLLHKVFCDK